MTIFVDVDGHKALCKVIGKRLRAARKAAGLTEHAASEAIGHKSLTQISLIEGGSRMPPMLTVVKLCDLYVVPVDYVLGRIDDPIAERNEQRQAVIARAVSKTMQDGYASFASSVAQQVSIAVDSFSVDRMDMGRLVEAVKLVKSALERVMALNPEFEEDWRGSANLFNAVTAVEVIGKDIEKRHAAERCAMSAIERTRAFELEDDRAMQFQIELGV